MKTKLSFLLAIITFYLALVGCGNSHVKNDYGINNEVESSIEGQEATMVFAKLPSPPVCKKTHNREIINKIINFIDNYEKKSIANEDLKGWSMLINVTTSERQKQYSIVGNTLTIDNSCYSVSDDFINTLENLYDEIDAQEEKYIIKN